MTPPANDNYARLRFVWNAAWAGLALVLYAIVLGLVR